jgi:hypothetical protein
MPHVDEDAPQYHFPDEENESTTIGSYGWEQTDAEHGYCEFCGHRYEHTTSDCPSRPPSRDNPSGMKAVDDDA